VPVLARHGVPANQNVIANSVLSGKRPWETELYDFLNSAPFELLAELTLPGFSGGLQRRDGHSKLLFGLRLSRFLKERARHDRKALWDDLVGQMARVDRIRETRMLRRDDVLTLVKGHGIEVGAHSIDHDSMGHESTEFFRGDVRACQAFFQDELHQPLSIYAFPNGSHRPEQIQALLDEGVKHVLLVGNELSRVDVRVHPRLTFYGESPSEIRLRATGYRAPAP
jgi:peptidoglycan/xylan/chitin deacetylase (PgdA/CDA1 family)